MKTPIKLFFKNRLQIWKIVLFAVMLLFFTTLFLCDLLDSHKGFVLFLDIATYVVLSGVLLNLLLWQFLGGQIVEISGTDVTCYMKGVFFSKKHHITSSFYSETRAKFVIDYSRTKGYYINTIDDNLNAFRIGYTPSIEDMENLVNYLKGTVNKESPDLPINLKKYQKR